jgi:hypothetical protein
MRGGARSSTQGMELIAAIVLAGPLGFFARRWGLGLYVLAWVLILPIQTIQVHDADPDDINWQYVVVNAAILAFGVGLNRVGAGLAARRARAAEAA